MKRQSWAALTTTGLLLAYGCAEPEPLGSVFIRDLSAGAGAADGGVDPGAGGTGPGQGGTGPAPGTGGTGGTGAAPGTGGTGAAPSTGGTGGAAGGGGTGGAPGAGGTGTGAGGTAPVATGDCVESDGLIVFYRQTSNADQNIQMTLAVQVQPSGTFATSDLTLRYWFSGGAPADFVGEIDYASNGTNQTVTPDVNVTFGTELGSNYADINVDRAEAIGVGLQSIQVRIHNAAFSTLAPQTDDFSYDAAATQLQENPNVTAFVAGEQVFGCTPPAQ
jgi:hypothetical protein